MCETKTKVCSKCGEEKPLTKEYFYSRKESKDGFRSDCKVCNNKLRVDWRRKNKERDTNNNKEWREKNREHFEEYTKNWREKNKEYRRQYRKEYNKKNVKKIIEYNIKYRSEKLKNDKFYKMKHHISVILNLSFKKQGWSKKTKTQEILGCDWETFVEHIENQFQEGMTWDNHGRYGWHYDHIIPIASAKTEEDLIRLNHYTNFQPLWAEDNLRKSDKISEEWGNLENTSNTSIR